MKPRSRSAMIQFLASLVKAESGVTAVEYALIAALIAIAAITIMTTTGSNMSKTFSTVAGKL
jgi:pilus assembly protein Flp/PilA